MVHMMAEQARLAQHYPSFPLDCGVELQDGSGVERHSLQDPSAQDPRWLQVPPLMGEVIPGCAQVVREEDLGDEDSPLEAMGEAMVEDLVGEWDAEPEAHAPSLLEDLSDAFHKVAAASEALSKVIDSEMRRSAPTFVPGQMWTGQGRSSFVD